MLSAKNGIKDNSKRRYPGVGGRKNNPIGIALRKKEALERNEAWAKLSPRDQLAALDAKGYRALKQRAKIQARIDRERSKVAEAQPKRSKTN